MITVSIIPNENNLVIGNFELGIVLAYQNLYIFMANHIINDIKLFKIDDALKIYE